MCPYHVIDVFLVGSYEDDWDFVVGCRDPAFSYAVKKGEKVPYFYYGRIIPFILFDRTCFEKLGI